jgi:hypothetical protein
MNGPLKASTRAPKSPVFLIAEPYVHAEIPPGTVSGQYPKGV